MGCRCGERRTALGQGLRAAGRGDLSGVRAAAGLIGRTTVEDVEAMARRMRLSMAKGENLASGIPERREDHP